MKKTPWAKNSFGEISIDGLQEDFDNNEKMAVWYLNDKFWEEVTNEIKDRIYAQLLADWLDYRLMQQ